MTKEQEKAYKEIKDFATTLLESGGHVTATVVIAQIVRMHQVLMGHTIDEEGVEHVLSEKRTAALLDLLQDYDGKAIIWCSYGHDVKKVSAALAKEFECPVAKFYGGNEFHPRSRGAGVSYRPGVPVHGGHARRRWEG